jgi:hypothetical protein
MTCAERQGLSSTSSEQDGGVLLISTPEDTQEEKSQSTDGEKTTDKINPLQNFQFSEISRIHSGRRPVKEEEHAKRPTIKHNIDPGTPPPRR